jgi:hypothetical protein
VKSNSGFHMTPIHWLPVAWVRRLLIAQTRPLKLSSNLSPLTYNLPQPDFLQPDLLHPIHYTFSLNLTTPISIKTKDSNHHV